MALFTLGGLALGAGKLALGVGKGILGAGKTAAKAGVKSGAKMASAITKRAPRPTMGKVSGARTSIPSQSLIPSVSGAKKSSSKSSGVRSIDNVLDTIDNTLFNAINVTSQSSKLKQNIRGRKRRERGRMMKKGREKVLETSSSLFKKIGSAAIAPAQGLGEILKRFFGNIFAASLVLWIVKNWYRILGWIKKGWEKIQEGLKAMEPIAKVLWNIGKWIAGPLVGFLRSSAESLGIMVKDTPSLEDKQSKDVDKINQLGDEITEQGNILMSIWDAIRNREKPIDFDKLSDEEVDKLKKDTGESLEEYGYDEKTYDLIPQKNGTFKLIKKGDAGVNKTIKKSELDPSKGSFSDVKAKPNLGTPVRDAAGRITGYYKDINTTVEFQHPDLSSTSFSLFTQTDYETASSTTIVMMGDDNNGSSGGQQGSGEILPLPLPMVNNSNYTTPFKVELSKVG